MMMKRDNPFSTGEVSEDMARVSALFESHRHRKAPREVDPANPVQGPVEVPCELAPAVRRRSPKPLTQES
jgi:hypothetical protein